MPFYREDATQPAARYHADGEGPVQYLATTPDAAWAEYLRHEEITDPAELPGIRRSMWVVEVIVDQAALARPGLPQAILTGGLSTYSACQSEARRHRSAGGPGLIAPSAAVEPSSESGHRTDGGSVAGPVIDEETVVLFGTRPDDVGWLGCAIGRPSEDQLARVHSL